MVSPLEGEGSRSAWWPLSADRERSHSGNLPRTRARYSFRTRPSMKSEMMLLAAFALRAKNMRPEVKRSRRLTAGKTRSDLCSWIKREGRGGRRTPDLAVRKVSAREHLSAGILRVASSRMNWHAAWLIDDDELLAWVLEDDLDGMG